MLFNVVTLPQVKSETFRLDFKQISFLKYLLAIKYLTVFHFNHGILFMRK